MIAKPLFLDSITDSGINSAGRIVLSGSHGGVYPAALASNSGIRGVIFNDAGIGFEKAGIAGVSQLADIGMAAAALDCHSCRIGSAYDAFTRGRVSIVNVIANKYGVKTGMSATEALDLLAEAPLPRSTLPPAREARYEAILPCSERRVLLLDSASLVVPGDTGKIVVTGSHGGLVGGDPRRALKAHACVGVFNDAGVGIDNIGITRLPVLDQCEVAAVTVSCKTARIGDAASALETGVISYVNKTAKALGALIGTELKAWLENLPDKIG